MTTLPKKDEAVVADWKVEVRDWWYSIQDRLAEKDICLHERKRVEIENIIKNVLTAKNAEIEEAMREERSSWLSGNRCSVCGEDNLDSKGLSDICGNCYEEQ